MTTMVDTIVSGVDTNWDGTIITKPPILSKRNDPTANWFNDIGGIAVDSILFEQHEDRRNEITGIDGAERPNSELARFSTRAGAWHRVDPVSA